jgi:SHS2 domain-containing protein
MKIKTETFKGNNKKFEFFEVTADTGYWAYGNTLEESFENAGLAMFEVMTNTKNVNPLIKKEITIISEDKVSLLYDWLSELLFLHDTEFIFFSKFKVEITKENNEYKLIADIYGEEINYNKHNQANEVKAVTFHLMEIERENKIYKSRVILDL